MIRMGVIGAGRIGRLHAESVARRVANAELVALCDVNEAAVNALAGELGVDAVYTDHKAMLAAGGLDAVAICSYSTVHAEQIVDCAAAGVHIFCEKPIALDLGEIDRAIGAADSAGVKLFVGFNRRFDANMMKVKQVVDEGAVGDVHIVHVISRDPAPPSAEYAAASGGMFVDMTIHDFDMVRYLTGSEVVEVYAVGTCLVDAAIGQAGDIDTALITLKFANGAIGMIDNSREAKYGYDQRVEVFGSNGMVKNDNKRPDSAVVYTAEGSRGAENLNFFLEWYIDSYIYEMQRFVDCVINDTDVDVSGLDARKPVVIAMAANKSMVESRPVRVDEIG